jgi:outer membrane protein OmpA-like peptidoglycan-associated protein
MPFEATRKALSYLVPGIILGIIATLLTIKAYNKYFSASLDTHVHESSSATVTVDEGLQVKKTSWRFVDERREGQFPFKVTEVLCLWKVEIQVAAQTPGVAITFILHDTNGFEIARDEQHIGQLSAGTTKVVTGRFWIGPKMAGLATNPNVRLTRVSTEEKITLPGDVLFDFGKWEIRPDAAATLRQAAEVVKQHKASIAIDGYTDATGSDTYNLQLSKRRAAAVKAWLVQQGGIDEQRITTEGWGEAKPVAPNTHLDGSDHPEGRQKNRRVEITMNK